MKIYARDYLEIFFSSTTPLFDSKMCARFKEVRQELGLTQAEIAPENRTDSDRCFANRGRKMPDHRGQNGSIQGCIRGLVSVLPPGQRQAPAAHDEKRRVCRGKLLESKEIGGMSYFELVGLIRNIK
jgi:hypothetical protein